MIRKSRIVDVTGSPYVVEHHIEYRSTLGRAYDPPQRGGFEGVTGISGQGGRPKDQAEWARDWSSFQKRADRIERIRRRSGHAAAAYMMRRLPLINGDFVVEEPGTDEEPTTDLEMLASDWVRHVYEDGPAVPWWQLIDWLSHSLGYGVSVVEGAFGMMDWHGGRYLTPIDWEHRKPRSISRASVPWVFEDGRLVRINQDLTPDVSGQTAKPMEARNCLVITYGGSGGSDIEGESIFRPIDRAEQVTADCWNIAMIGIERWGAPTPVVKLTDSETAAELETAARNAAQAYKVNHRGGVVLFPGMEWEVSGAAESQHTAWDKALAMAVDEIATGLNVPLLRIGTVSNSGNRALSETFTESALSVTEKDARVIMAQLQRQQVDPLVRANFGPIRCPKVSIAGIAKQMTQQMLDHFKTMGEVGIEITDADEDFIRTQVGAPPRQEPEIETERESEGGTVPPEADVAPVPGLGGGSEESSGDNSEPPGEEESEREEAEMAASVDVAAEEVGRRRYSRSLKEHERWVDFRTIEASQDDAVEQIARAVEAVRLKAVDDLVSKVESAADAGSMKPRDIERMVRVDGRIVREMENAVTAILQDVEKMGRASVRKEQMRMSAFAQRMPDVKPSQFGASLCMVADALYEFQDPNLPASSPENAPSAIRMKAASLVRGVLQPLQETARAVLESALSSGRTVAGIAAAAINALRLDLIDRSARTVTNAAGRVVPAIFGLGRKRAAEAIVDESGQQFRQRNSALLDDKACPNCIAAEDYTESNVVLAGSATGDGLYPPVGAGSPTGACEGRGRCRCIATFTVATPEEIAEAV